MLLSDIGKVINYSLDRYNGYNISRKELDISRRIDRRGVESPDIGCFSMLQNRHW